MKNEIIRFDWAMKKLLRNKADFAVVEGLLTVLLERPIHIKSLLESEGNQQHAEDKFNRVDLLAEDEDGELMIFEIQNNRALDYFHRMTYGVSKVMTEYISLGQNYVSIRKIYSINIVYFELGQGVDYIYHGYTEFHGLHDPKDILTLSERQRDLFHCNTPADIMPEYYLLRVNNFDKVATTPLDEWVQFLKTGDISSSATAPGLKEARERWLVSTMSDEERRSYNRYMDNLMYQNSMLHSSHVEGHWEGFHEGFDDGLKKGIEQGKMEEKIIIATKLKEQGIPANVIASTVGLDMDVVNDL